MIKTNEVIYATTNRFSDGHESFYKYFPTKETAKKMWEEELEDGWGRSDKELIYSKIKLPTKLGNLTGEYHKKVYTKDGAFLSLITPSKFTLHEETEMFKNVNVITYVYEERKYYELNHSYYIVDITTEEAKQIIADYIKAKKEEKQRSVENYLNSPFVKGWLNKMQYTERIDEYGHKFLFIAIKCGYNKLSDKSFQKICDAICARTYGDDLRMNMWIGGKVNWTMFYQRPDHVDGHETYFCGVVGKDDFSPEDWDKDHSEYSFKNANRY